MSLKIIITTHPFTRENEQLLKLEADGAVVKFNPHLRKMSPEEHKNFLIQEQPDVIIAGTEMYTPEVLDLCPNLKFISRVGIGMDSVDLDACAERGIKVTNTPDAPTNAVAELIIGQMLTLLRGINRADIKIRIGEWERYIGREIKNCNVGIIGCGRIGSSVLKKIKAFEPNKIYINDIDEDKVHSKLVPNELDKIFFATKEQILKECDIISIHIPYSEENKNFISMTHLEMMKKNSIIINSSRGGIINEFTLFGWLKTHPNAGAAIDAFVQEPYKGQLSTLGNILLTPHMGSCSKQSRADMESQSIGNVIDFLND